MAHLLAFNVLLLPKDLTIIFIFFLLHTCNENERKIREVIFLPFQGEICIIIDRKIPDSFQGDFDFLLKSGSFFLLMREASHVCTTP